MSNRSEAGTPCDGYCAAILSRAQRRNLRFAASSAPSSAVLVGEWDSKASTRCLEGDTQNTLSGVVQVTLTEREEVCQHHPHRYTALFHYQKPRVAMFTTSNWRPIKEHFKGQIYTFPFPTWKLPAGAKQVGGSASDVWTMQWMEKQKVIRERLDIHAAETNDRPIPKYQMIIDPNLFTHDRRWVPCEFDVDTKGKASLVGGEVAHEHPDLVDTVATPILNAAMPMLAKLSRPAILLEDRRLQVVVKAQSIIVDDEYVGLWHVDGDAEDVVAVVLYYYNVDEDLEGGDLEFASKEPIDVLGWGDCSNNVNLMGRKALHTALRPAAGEDPKIPNCRVPVKTGTLVVFSNYQMVHRVLRMQGSGRRDFVALFVIDPSNPLVPASQHLAKQNGLQRILTAKARGRRLPKDVVRRVLEFTGDVVTQEAKVGQRFHKLRNQLTPMGSFGSNDCVYATGNGCYTLIGWVNSMLDLKCLEYNESGGAVFASLTLPPTDVGRGMSQALSLTTTEREEMKDFYLNPCELEAELAEAEQAAMAQ